MKRMGILLLGLVMACMPAMAMAGTDVWVAYTSGEIEVAVDGSVSAFKVTQSAGKEVDPLIEQQVLAWRFDPVIENGHAIPVKGRADLSLRGIETEGRAMQISIADAKFFEFVPGTKKSIESIGDSLPPPSYPMRPLQEDVMAKVIAIVSISRDGAVTGVEFEKTDLRYLRILPSNKKSARHANYFETAVREAARSWRLNPRGEKFNGSGVSRQRIPVFFSIPGLNWGRLVSIAGSAASQESGSDVEVADLSAGGAKASERIALQTELMPLPGG